MGMTASDDGPATGSAPQRFGPDLWPRVAAAVAMGSVAVAATWIGGFLFAAFWWLASIVVLWEWQRLVGGERLIVARVVAGAVALALAALSALHDSIAGVVAALILGAAAVGWIAGGRQGIWAAAGVLYAGALVASVGLLRVSPSFGMASILWLFAVVWGADIAAYFAGRLIGGPRLWPRVSPGKTWAGAIVGAFAGAVLGLMLAAWTNRLAARPRDGDCVRAWRFVRIRAQAAFRRQGFERPHSRPWRIDGSARRLHLGIFFRRGRRNSAP
jgi:phosphatidate cytidylyltransferase